MRKRHRSLNFLILERIRFERSNYGTSLPSATMTIQLPYFAGLNIAEPERTSSFHVGFAFPMRNVHAVFGVPCESQVTGAVGKFCCLSP
jgi:hypothetical protein